MKLLLVDGHSLAYRAFFAMPALTNSKGEGTQAVLGVANMIFKILKDEQPTHMIVFFDREIPQFRLQAYEAYKANRQKPPDDFLAQLPLIKKFFELLGIQVFEEVGFEADDWIAATVSQAEKYEGDILVLSGDLDLLQLVSEKTTLLASRKGISNLNRYNLEEVNKRYGLIPAQLGDFKALVGDTSDNIQGVPGMGEKTAIKFLQKWGTLEGIMEHVQELPEKLKANLQNSQEKILTNKHLVTLRHDAPFVFQPEVCLVTPYGSNELREFFEEMEFHALSARLGLKGDVQVPSVEFEYVEGDDAIEKIEAAVREVDTVSLILWPPLSPFWENHHLALAIPENKRFVVAPTIALKALQSLNASLQTKEVFVYNEKNFSLSNSGMCNHFDTLIAGWLCNSVRTDPSIPDLARDVLQISLPTAKETPVMLAHWVTPLIEVGHQLREKMKKLDVTRVYDEIEFPLIDVLATMEKQGVAINASYLRELSGEISEILSNLEGEIYREAGFIFNINSSKQLAEVLYDKFNLPRGRKTKTGYSTDVEELERLALISPVATKLLQYRELSKLQNTYVDVFPNLVNPKTGRVHTTYVQAGAATGRLASKEPNLQNIPIRTEYGRRIRKAFIAGNPGWKIFRADYSQIELRLLAHFSEDPVLIEAFQAHQDIHARTASEIFSVLQSDVTSEMRRMAKVVNFGIIYGMTEHGLSQNLGMKREEAKLYIQNYLSRFPQVESYMAACLNEAREKGVTRTLFGRVRPVPELHSKNSYIRQQAERIGLNTGLQGTAADLIKLAMIRIQDKIIHEKLNAHLLMQVHDELVFEVSDDDLQKLALMVKEEMENVCQLRVPLIADLYFGPNWTEVEPMTWVKT